MSQRVTIAVPEPLFTRLQPVKHQFNISAVCQEALDVAACKQEGAGLQTRLSQAQIKMQINWVLAQIKMQTACFPGTLAQIKMQTACKQELRLKLKCK